jgi:FAD/FMN-containing dehydrogenase
MTSLAHAALDQLSALLGKRCLTDPDSAQRYGVDWTKVWAPAPSAVVLPETTEEVQQIVEIANEHGLHLVPSGGRTGLSAGAVAANGELVVAFDRMNRVLDFNEYDRSVTVQPGVVTQQLQEFADSKELFYPVDFASAGSSQIGGNINTNAGGIKVIRYGMTGTGSPASRWSPAGVNCWTSTRA